MLTSSLNKNRCRCKWDVPFEYLTRAIFEKQLRALYVVHTFHLFNRYVFILLTKMRTETDLIYFQRSDVYTHWFSHMCLTLLLAFMRNQRIFLGKSEALLSLLAICLLFWWFYLSSVWWLANINMWKSDYMKAWNSMKNDCGRFVENQMQWSL